MQKSLRAGLFGVILGCLVGALSSSLGTGWAVIFATITTALTTLIIVKRKVKSAGIAIDDWYQVERADERHYLHPGVAFRVTVVNDETVYCIYAGRYETELSKSLVEELLRIGSLVKLEKAPKDNNQQ